MDKPTIFFSHSSHDKDAILPIKNRLSTITASAIEIFMSSDGQSIPFGRNWVHKIEDGLSKAEIMFVFVTPVSIESGWIYFEAGYAYSRGIQVIPVGIGIDIGQIKAPLNLLQGFNITSVDSLDNFVTVINDKFNLTFNTGFTDSDYDMVFSSITGMSELFNFSDMFLHADYKLHAEYIDSKDNSKTIQHDVDKYFSNIKDHLVQREIPYSSYKSELLVNGIKISVVGSESNGNPRKNDKRLSVRLSAYSLESSFPLLQELLIASGVESKYIYLKFFFKDGYDCIHDEAAISSVVFNDTSTIKYNDADLGGYSYGSHLKFRIFGEDKDGYKSNKPLYYVLLLNFMLQEVKVNDVVALLRELQKIGLIIKT